MATLYSDQITGLLATPQTKTDSGVSNGKERVECFTWTGDAAQNDTVQLARLPVGARILGGRVDFTDFGSTVTLSIGDGTTAGKYGSSIDITTAAGQADFANTWALYGLGRERLSTAIVLTASFLGANPDSGSLRGYIKYTVE